MQLENNNIDELFERLKGHFDTQEPETGHQNRFLEKLNTQSGTKTLSALGNTSKKGSNWYKTISIAASFALLIGLGATFFAKSNPTLAEVSPEADKAQFYFTALIEQEVEKLNTEATPETQKLVDDALLQLKKLEEGYNVLEAQLINKGDAKQLLSAMITNFQTRIQLLEEVLQKIENIKQLKMNKNENYVI